VPNRSNGRDSAKSWALTSDSLLGLVNAIGPELDFSPGKTLSVDDELVRNMMSLLGLAPRWPHAARRAASSGKRIAATRDGCFEFAERNATYSTQQDQ
jgi:hypothetical protein